MAIKTQLSDRLELFYVTESFHGELWEVIMSKRELQSEIQRQNCIVRIHKAVITKGEEVDTEYIKPKNYKGKPYTYEEKYGGK